MNPRIEAPNPAPMTRDEAVAALAAWAASMRAHLGDERFDHACAPHIDAVLIAPDEPAQRRAAIGLSHAVTELNAEDFYVSEDRTWISEAARELWTRGHAVRDALLAALAPS